MIPADHISFNDDGTAWLVRPGRGDGQVFIPLTETFHPNVLVLDRPCDHPYYKKETGRCVWENVPGGCIDGRHTFTIEVPTATAAQVLAGPHVPGPRTYRVSVIPGMVLPIARDLDHSRDMIVSTTAHIWISNSGQAMWWTPDKDDDDLIWNYITLPSAAAPGMWAVKLKVAA